MSLRLGLVALPSTLVMLVTLGGCGAVNASLPPAAANPAHVTGAPNRERNLTSFSAQLYGNELVPYTGNPQPRPAVRIQPHRPHIFLNHGVPES